MSKIAMRNFWFQFHKWIGILLAIAIIPISLTGAALVWHDALDEALNPQRFAETGAPMLAPSAYVAAAKHAIGPDQRVSQLAYPESGTGPVRLVLANPPQPGERRPVRTTLWLDPADGHVIDKARSDEGAVRFMHVLHGSLFIPGWGRPIVGWIGVAMLVSSVSGIWLWWPTVGSWVRGLRWRRQNSINANLHHMLGFWIALPLAVLSLTGAWISFPKVFSAFDAAPAPAADAKAAGKAPGKGGEKGSGGKREAGRPQPPAQPLIAPALGPDAALAAARQATQRPIASIGWPTEKSADWEIRTAGKAGSATPPLTIAVADADAGARIKPNQPNARGPVMQLMRKIHDGTDMGIVWQIIIFLGGIIPAILSVTGLIMWWRSRQWRRAVKARQATRHATPGLSGAG